MRLKTAGSPRRSTMGRPGPPPPDLLSSRSAFSTTNSRRNMHHAIRTTCPSQSPRGQQRPQGGPDAPQCRRHFIRSCSPPAPPPLSPPRSDRGSAGHTARAGRPARRSLASAGTLRRFITVHNLARRAVQERRSSKHVFVAPPEKREKSLQEHAARRPTRSTRRCLDARN